MIPRIGGTHNSLCCSYFMKLLMDKKYALPYRVLDSVVAHFVRFVDDERDLPVIWHQSLLTFIQRYTRIYYGCCVIKYSVVSNSCQSIFW